MVEGARLESVYTPKGYRGFESLTLRPRSPKLLRKKERRRASHVPMLPKRDMSMESSASYGGHRPPDRTCWFVYILACKNGSHYVGCTNDLSDRLRRHNCGHVRATSYRRPLVCVTYVVFLNKYKAYAFEKYLKSGSGRAFMNKRLI